MIIPLDKLISIEGNKYVFSCAAMKLIDKLGNIENYPKDDLSWKVVPNVLKMMLDGELKYEFDVEQHQKSVKKDITDIIK